MKMFPIFVALAAVGVIAAHWVVFTYVPMEEEMRAIQRVFYFHVPSAWLCYLGFIICFGASLNYLWIRKTKADAVGLAAAETGLLFGTIVLVTGPLWARAAWGVWWRWEPRLTTMALLYLVFAAYWVLRTFGGQTEGIRRFGAILAVLGTPNIYFVHYAVEKWRGDHPDDVVTRGLTNDMRVGLYGTLLVLMITFFLLLRLRYRMHRDALTVRAIRRRLARLGGLG